MINWLANLSNRIALLCIISISLVACGGGSGSGGGFIPDDDVSVPLNITTAELPVAAAGADYTALVGVEGGKTPYSWAIIDDGGTGFAINSEGFITGTAPQRGDYGLTLEVTDNANNTDKLSIILTVDIGPDALAITSTALPNAIDGIQYTALLEAAGGKEPYAWTLVDDGGTGFTINNEGLLTGTAPAGGQYGLTLQVTDASSATDKTSIILTVTGDTPQPLSIATTSLPNAEEQKGYAAILEAVGGQGDYQWTLISNGGSGLQLRDDGLLNGTAPAEGQYGITVSVMDDTRTVSDTLILTVTADSSPLAITTSSLPNGTVKGRYAAILNASGGDTSYTWTLLSNGGSGLSLSTAGVLSGTPALAGTFGLIFKVSDGTRTTQQALTLAITAAGGTDEVLNITSPQAFTADRVLFAAAMAATGGVPPYRWTGKDVSSPGTSFEIDEGSGTLTGNTNDLLPGQYGYSVTVTDTANQEDTQSIVITIPGGDLPPIKILTENPLPTAYETLTYTTILRSVGGEPINTWTILDTAGFTGTPPAFTNPQEGVLVWNAADTVQGNYLITIQVVSSDSDITSDVVTFDLQASAAPVRITSAAALPGGVVGTAYSTVISAEGGGGTDTWSVVSVTGSASATEPDFNSLADIASGTLTWPAPEEGTYTVTVKVVSEDGSGIASDDEKEFELEILPNP
ncbi:MAG: hypothetical protein ACI8QT_000728 [Halioglobus sp.]|jgi:hypothetical protein